MAVHAHEDDETITMGGTLATYADRGVKTCVVCCTDGKLATIVDPNMPEETTRPRLAEIREAELREACRILNVDEVEFLRYGDSGMADTPTNQLPDAFWMAPINEATGKIVAQIRRFRPHVVVTYDGNGGYGHPDHIQTHRATLLAVEAARLVPLYKDAGELVARREALLHRVSEVPVRAHRRDGEAGRDRSALRRGEPRRDGVPHPR